MAVFLLVSFEKGFIMNLSAAYAAGKGLRENGLKKMTK